MKLFLVAPVNDRITKKITAVWAKDIADWLEPMKIDKTVMIGKDVSREAVEKALKPHHRQPGLFCFIDHGMYGRLLDSGDGPMIDQENIQLLENKFIYAIACKSARDLGPRAVAAGARGFLGFTRLVYIGLFEDVPRITGKCLMSGFIRMMRNGCTAVEAMRAITERTNDAIKEVKKRKKLPKKRLVLTSSPS